MNRIEDLSVSAYTIPTDFPESDGTLEWDKTTIVIVRARAGGATGIGYTFADTATADLIRSKLAGVAAGHDANDVQETWMMMARAIRNLGRPGVASMAISAVDISLWDLKAKLLRLPLVKLLGMVRDGIPVYGSGGFTSYSTKQLADQLGGWVKQGISRVKMKVGRDPLKDMERVEAARRAIGEDAELFVDANGAYSRKQALMMAEQFREYGVTWFEEPVTSDDLEGLRLIRNRGPAGMNVTAGEYGYDLSYFRRMLDAGSVDVLQADATRCGGITGFLGVAALCEAHQIPLSAHTAPAAHLPLGCAIPGMRHLEYFHDHVRIEEMLFEGVTLPCEGVLHIDLSRPGLGLELKKSAVGRYAA
ncbi:MAG TPA: enolase C-terminal domain-like protein [Terriglobia bacterium]|nr:enolase C-terminal domain-like protein [Terriglobia bacterium]